MLYLVIIATKYVVDFMESIGTPDSRIGANNLNRFVTRIWEHPLVTELTKKKREEAFQEVNNLFKDIKNIFF